MFKRRVKKLWTTFHGMGVYDFLRKLLANKCNGWMDV